MNDEHFCAENTGNTYITYCTFICNYTFICIHIVQLHFLQYYREGRRWKSRKIETKKK